MRKLILILLLLISNDCISQKIIQRESLQSLYIEVYYDSVKIGNATGFVIRSKSTNYLVTNFHVLTNQDPVTLKWVNSSIPKSPNKILIVHNGDSLGTHVIKKEILYNSKGPKYFYDTLAHSYVDVVELPLSDTANVKIYPVDFRSGDATKIKFIPTDRVFVLGFPMGEKSSPFFPIWKSGLIASEPDFDQEGKPIMWLDIYSFGGMSGSPTYFMNKGDIVQFKDGSKGITTGGPVFMGVFSHSDKFNVYGALWKASFLSKIFDKLP